MAINKKTLLEQAKLLVNVRASDVRYSEEEVELALAWANGEITLTQVARAKGLAAISTAYPFLACALRQWLNEENK